MTAKRQALHERVWRVVAAVPPGCVVSYGQVAELAGLARGARQVSRIMSLAPKEMALPWHRVINAAGRIAISKDSPAYKEQRKRLLSEGVLVKGDRIRMADYRWQPTLDEIMWRL